MNSEKIAEKIKKGAEIQFPNLDFYVEGDVSNMPSKIIKITTEGDVQKLR